MLDEALAEEEAHRRTPAGKRAARRERWNDLRADWRDRGLTRTSRRRWPKCGARCRDGHACQAPPVRDKDTKLNRNGRCRMHGGLSTGPKSAEGRARIAAAARRMMLERWKAKRGANRC
jgi:hypothetical protein